MLCKKKCKWKSERYLLFGIHCTSLIFFIHTVFNSIHFKVYTQWIKLLHVFVWYWRNLITCTWSTLKLTALFRFPIRLMQYMSEVNLVLSSIIYGDPCIAALLQFKFFKCSSRNIHHNLISHRNSMRDFGKQNGTNSLLLKYSMYVFQ